MAKKLIYKIIMVILFFLLFTIIIYYGYFYLNNIYNKCLIKKYFSTYKESKDFISAKEDVNYIGILEIPKINFIRGFYDVNDKNNNVNNNIQLLQNSSMPDKNNSFLAIASHSGRSKNAYFNDLIKLQNQDIANIYYQNKLYRYQIKNIYSLPKTGTILIDNSQTNRLVLTTCSRLEKNKQLIIVADLIQISNY